MIHVMWFREDLRIEDNHALSQAAKEESASVIALYIVDFVMWKEHRMSNTRIQFLLEGIQALEKDLASYNIPLIIIESEGIDKIPALLLDVMKRLEAKKLFFNNQYEVNEKRRDHAVKEHLAQYDIEIYAYDDQFILPPNQLITKSGTPFTVFGPYKKAWQNSWQRQHYSAYPLPKKQRPSDYETAIPKNMYWKDDFTSHSTINHTHWPAGTEAAQKRLKQFMKSKLDTYGDDRNFPSKKGTSKLSAYLSTGMISPRSCFNAVFRSNQGSVASGNRGAVVWMQELIWRDFYKQVLINYPRVSMHRPYKKETERLTWVKSAGLLDAWKEGMTGFPFVDAGMRQLNQTGWMHNRLRMVVAMFFSKQLRLDWRVGEAYFVDKLIDCDLSSNNGGWQWCASTGTDPVPYFRIFNPVRQSERFDPTGEFIKTYCPELKAFDAKSIHDPTHRAPLLPKKYPRAIVDLDKSRIEAIKAFKDLR